MGNFAIYTAARKVSPDWVEKYQGLPVANVSDVLDRMVAAGPDLRPWYTGTPMIGPAVTVKARPGDNLMVHAALDLAQPGEVVVVDAGGDTTNAIIGELMVAHAIQRKLGGIVINGAIRDSAELLAGSFPVFATGVTHRGPYKDGPGTVNAPIAIGGMVITAGDLILGDADGVVAVPFDQVAEAHARARAKHAAETQQMDAIRRGENDRAWVQKRLQDLGCTFA
ncbi:RraA family protein [Ketogulonicigenium vulgare]|uniref:RraA family protein n=1 Tax=Ketogulonicigenium vulgare TaxID=92945 RepID=UPI0023597671|nr:RraA family protein [Ketogulonicigenium vulgare]